jgi:chemotaxis protein methyltransferase CheR
MRDQDCVHFLQWALPRLHLQWKGYRRVRRLVCKRISRRMRVLGLQDIRSYRAFLEADEDEWAVLDSMCRISISRFFRDRGVFTHLETEILPRLARSHFRKQKRTLHCWCAGCASGEEAYSLLLLWKMKLEPGFPGAGIRIVATDSDPHLLERARIACYPFSSVKNLPPEWLAEAFIRSNGGYCLREEFKHDIVFMEQDIRQEVPDRLFDLVLCRNMAFTYFDETVQLKVLETIRQSLRPGGILVLGSHESLPGTVTGIVPRSKKYRSFSVTDL